PLHRWEPLPELVCVLHIGEDGDAALDLLPAGAGAPGEERALEGADAGLDQIDVRDAAAPAGPGAVLLVARLDPPLLIHRDRPVVGIVDPGRAGQPGTDRVGQGLRERVDVGILGALTPDLAENGVVGREVLSHRRRGGGQDPQPDGGCGDQALHRVPPEWTWLGRASAPGSAEERDWGEDGEGGGTWQGLGAQGLGPRA